MTIMQHVNGTQRGRIVPPLPEHTFKDSGVTIRIRKVGPTTQQRMAQAIMVEMPEPMPPMNDPDSEAAQLGEKYNRADPDFERAKEEWENKSRQELTNRLMLIAALGAEVDIDDRARTEIARKKRSYQIAHIPYDDNPDMSDEENERVFYILHVCAASPEDLGEFGAAVLRRSVPTEEAVQSQIATFQRDVPES